jgi:arabinofuranosyltransferase
MHPEGQVGGPVRLSQRSAWLRRSLVFVIALSALWHARSYDFFCDDAFIALRYAKNLIEHHELAYNLGQRVEGFTSPLWVLLVSAVGSLGVELVAATRLLAAAAGMGTFWALTLFWDELNPEAPWLVLPPALALAMSAPFAAWIFGGLETPLFVATFTLALASIARHARVRALRSLVQAALSVAFCALCRPEGATLIAMGSVVLCLLPSPASQGRLWRRLLVWALPILLLVGGYELFRLRYYGYPLPNTFYVKTSGEGLWQRGVTYLGFAGSEFGWALIGTCLLSLSFLLLPSALLPACNRPKAGRLLLRCTAAAATIHLLYVARIGGDFLDLYRFLTPLLPAAFAIVTCAGSVLFSATAGPMRFAVPIVAVGLLIAHGQSQLAMAREATQISASSRAALRLEPLGWTRAYALRWQGIGRWLARTRAQGDSTAVGAAGALPFFSELPNLDLFGLNDLEIARHGRIIGNRPGHQRFAEMDYLLREKPTFVFMSPESTPLRPGRLRYDRYWTSHGYLPIEIRVDRELCNCPETFYHQFLVRRERAASLRGREDAVLGGSGP